MPSRFSRPALLCVVPPYSTLGPPAGMAYLLAYLQNHDCTDFEFVDLRLGVPNAYAPTYSPTGVFGECYVIDVPDLPLVLALIRAFENGADPGAAFATVLEPYARERGISARYLHDYLRCMNNYVSACADRLRHARFVGCSVWTSNFLSTLLFAAHLKRRRPAPTIVLGGPQVTESPASAALALRSRIVDYVVLGEGEASLCELYSVVRDDGTTARPVPGTLALSAGDVIVRGPARPLLAPVEIPTPAFDQMALRSYEQTGMLTVPYHLSRGCTDKCTFCSEWVFWERFRPGSAERTVQGVRELQQRYGAESIAFSDSLLNGHPGRLRQLIQGMLRMRPRLTWSGYMRAQMDADTATQLRQAGCDFVFVGIESMSDATLALMNKRRTEPENVAALRAFLASGIHVVAGLIPGFPGDTRDAFAHTSRRLTQLQQEFPGRLRVNVEPFIVSPGQPLFRRLEEYGLHGVHWGPEIIDIAPRFADISGGILCRVEGESQGLERIGRLQIAQSMESDAPQRSDIFDYKGSEFIVRSGFEFEHLSAGWFLARTKGPNSLIHALIVSETEKEEIEGALPDEGWVNVLSAPRLRHLVKRIAAVHSIQPEAAPRLVPGGYRRVHDTPGVSYVLAPYVVARQTDWRLGSRLLVVEFIQPQWVLLPSWQRHILTALREAPHSATSLARVLARRRIRRSASQCHAALEDLAERGVAIIPAARSARTHQPRNVARPPERDKPAVTIPLVTVDMSGSSECS
jgi:radical SAM superfamily enzyme YgiQ (UPF0313 family)